MVLFKSLINLSLILCFNFNEYSGRRCFKFRLPYSAISIVQRLKFKV